MSSFQEILIKEIKRQGADFIHFVDVSDLSEEQNKGYPIAILEGIYLSPEYLNKVSITPDYVPQMIKKKEIEIDEFHLKEIKTDKIADEVADFIKANGYAAYSQSEKNLNATGFYDEKNKRTPLPHKTIAGMAGLGWIGKHNLLVTPEYGSAISMCSVLTDAPLGTVLQVLPKSKCGDCKVCKEICDPDAIIGTNWSINSSREDIVDVLKCTTCLMCLALCPWTQKYISRNNLK